MKTLKGLILGVCVTGLAVLLTTVSFAEGKHHKIDLGLIKKAADALQATHPDLAAGLSKYVDDETKEDLEKKDTNVEKEGAAEEKGEKEMKGQQEATIKLFKDSAEATQPDLAASLTKSANWNEKRLNEKKEGKEDLEKNEANEAKDK